jgi:hypothetical protein
VNRVLFFISKLQVVSHPADSIVSLINHPKYKGMKFVQIVKEVGIVRLSTRGLLPRMFVVGTAVGFQWWIYDSVKFALGYRTSGGNN